MFAEHRFDIESLLDRLDFFRIKFTAVANLQQNSTARPRPERQPVAGTGNHRLAIINAVFENTI